MKVSNIQTTNRFDFLRLLFASIVMLLHIVALAELTISSEAQLLKLAELSIQGFFVISGFLVYSSLERSTGLYDYSLKRVRRLYPAYVVIILVPAAISLVKGGAWPLVLKYAGTNLVFLNFLQPDLPGLFDAQRFPVVNGALWTLKIEVMFYMILPVLGWVLLKIGRAKWALLLTIYGAAEAWRQFIPSLDVSVAAQIGRQLPGQMSFFVVGMVFWMLRDVASKHKIWIALAGVMALVLSFVPGIEFLRAAGLGALVYSVAFGPGPVLNVARFGDFSYGVYITHFPIVNMMVSLGLFAVSPWRGLFITIGLVFATSFVLWHIIEKPALGRSNHYRRTTPQNQEKRRTRSPEQVG